MDRHLGPAPEPTDDHPSAFDDRMPMARSPWWRWVAVIVVIALVVATPFAFALSRLFD